MSQTTTDVEAGKRPSFDSEMEKPQSTFYEGTLSDTSKQVDDEYPDGGWRAWLTVFGAFLALMCTFGQLSSFGTFQSWYTEHQLQSFAPSTVSWIGSIQLWMFFFSGGFVGRIFDAYGPRMLMIPGTLVLVASTMVTSICETYYQYILSQGILFGLGVGMLFYPSLSAVSTHFKRYRATALGIAISGSGVGGVVYPIMLQRLFISVGFGWGVRISGFTCLLLCGIACCTVSSRLAPRTAPAPWLPAAPWRDTNFVLLVAGSACIALGLFVPNFYIVSYAVAHGAPRATAFYVLAALNGAGTLGRLVPACAADRAGRFNVLVPAAAAAGVAVLAGWPLAHGLGGCVAFAAVFGFASGAFNALVVPCVAQISDVRHIGTRIGLLYSVLAFPSLAGEPAAGALLRAAHGSYIGMIVFSGATVLLGSFFFLWVRLRLDSRLLARV
ncbi:MFS general substrate transporter [Phanerochaete sordida]|uniref:MFS general substrate transporter n=1 Tax=Phanerochaete sordida TaxID=48140 RepID=A0A9P3GS77_9APHY|nr:MFS general substrate transporter [Phanerochaete sordida]